MLSLSPRTGLLRLLVILAVGVLLPAGPAVAHGGETGPGHHEDDAVTKPAGGETETDRAKGADPEKEVVESDAAPAGGETSGGGSGGGSSPVPHFIALVALAAVGTAVIFFRRSRQRQSPSSG